MRQWSIQICRLRSQPDPVIFRQLLAHTHQAKTVRNHNQNNAHVLGKRKEQMVEVFRIDSCITGIQIRSLQ